MPGTEQEQIEFLATAVRNLAELVEDMAYTMQNEGLLDEEERKGASAMVDPVKAQATYAEDVSQNATEGDTNE